MQMRLPVFLLVLAAIPAYAGSDRTVLVEQGRPTAAAVLVEPAKWHEDSGCVTGAGVGAFLLSAETFRADNFTLDVELALERQDTTAATLVLGDAGFGLDGNAGAPFFFERPGAAGVTFAPEFHIGPGRFFHLTVEGRNGTVTFYGDGQKLGSVPFAPGKAVCFGLRPHRNRMSIRSFSVEATPVGRNSMILEQQQRIENTVPVIPEALIAGTDGMVNLKAPLLPAPGSYQVALAPVNADGKVEFPAEVTSEGTLTIPEAVLEKLAEMLPGTAAVRPFELRLLRANATILKNRGVLVLPEPWRGFPRGEVRLTHGRPGFYIDGKAVGTISGRLGRAYSSRLIGSAIRQFAEAGIHDNLVILFPYHYMHMNGSELVFDQDAFRKDLELFMNRTICEDPEARFHLHYELLMPSDWVDQYPDEAIRLDNGSQTLWYGVDKKLQPSYASEHWRREAGRILAENIQYWGQTPYADRITHLRLLYANCGEWNHWGYHEQAFADLSLPMQHAFGKWLERRYGTAEAWNRAWGTTGLNFDSENLIPNRAVRNMGHSPYRLAGSAAQPSVDYYTFFQEYAADTINYFARIAKEASNGCLLIGAYYGYYWGHFNSLPYHFQDSGHYGARYLLQSPWIDFFGGPYPYERRREGTELNGVTASLALHGKVWESEGDMRTHRSGADNKQYGTTDSLAESIALAKRDYILNRARKAVYYFFDFILDWYGDAEFMATVKRLHALDEAIREYPDRFPAQVALIASEEVIPYIGNKPSPTLNATRNAVRNFNQMWGVPYDMYLESDLDRIDFSAYKMVIFLNAAYAGDETIRLTRERVMRDGRVVMFWHVPGLIGPDNQLDLERARKFTGIGLNADPQKTFDTVRMQPGNSPYIQSAPTTFMTWIDDPKAEVFAVYPDGTPAGALKRFGTYTSVVLCHPEPNAAFMRTLFQRFGIHVYPTTNEYHRYFFSGPLIGVFSRKASREVLRLPQTFEVAGDVFSGQILARNSDRIEFATPAEPATTLIFVGTQQEWETIRPGT